MLILILEVVSTSVFNLRAIMKVFYDFITVVYLELKKEVNVCVLSLGILPI